MNLQRRKKYVVHHETVKGTLHAEFTLREILCLLLLHVGTHHVFNMPSLWQVKKWDSGKEIVYIFSFWKENIIFPKIIQRQELIETFFQEGHIP